MAENAPTYELRPENIACEPREIRMGRRDLGRMLVVDRATRTQLHSLVMELPAILSAGDVFIINDSRRSHGVLHARTVAENAAVELRFTQVDDDIGICRIYPSHFVDAGVLLSTDGGAQLIVLERSRGPHELWKVQSVSTVLKQILSECGTPITSFFYSDHWKLENYNPFYAQVDGSVESPLAGLHLTPELLDAMRQRGVIICSLTLHVIGSWLSPLQGAQPMMPEPFSIPDETADEITKARNRGNHIVACGSTVVRALETAARSDRTVNPGSGVSELSIKPGYHFKVVDRYFTNFHPSASSLMVLDSAFCDEALLISSYEIARDAGYLFFEFGDAILYR